MFVDSPPDCSRLPFHEKAYPEATGGHVGQVDIEFFLLGAGHELLAQPLSALGCCRNCRTVYTRLPVSCSSSSSASQFHGLEDCGLFTNRVGPDPEGQTGVGIVQIVRRADADVMNAILFALTPEHLQMPVKSFELSRKNAVSKQKESRTPTESLGSNADSKRPLTALMARRWQGAMYPATPVIAKFMREGSVSGDLDS